MLFLMKGSSLVVSWIDICCKLNRKAADLRYLLVVCLSDKINDQHLLEFYY